MSMSYDTLRFSLLYSVVAMNLCEYCHKKLKSILICIKLKIQFCRDFWYCFPIKVEASGRYLSVVGI